MRRTGKHIPVHPINLHLFGDLPEDVRIFSEEVRKATNPSYSEHQLMSVQTQYARENRETLKNIDADLKNISQKLDDLNKTLRFLAGRIGQHES